MAQVTFEFRQSGSEVFGAIDRIFADYALDAHVPGVVYGVVSDGKLVYVHGVGVQDLESKRPVNADTLFRIASMTKAFTALTVLKLRDDKKLQLDALAEAYIPEIRGWTYPTQDSPRIRVRDLLNHSAGFVTDDPWGDRQTPLPEADFSRLLQAGVPFSHAPGTGMEYSNLGFAMLGRIVTNVSGKPYADTIAKTILEPLSMTSSGFFVERAPGELGRSAIDGKTTHGSSNQRWRHGAFGAMGGLQTSANDYSKWVAFLLSAWPPRDDADRGLVKRATVRELARDPISRECVSASGNRRRCVQASCDLWHGYVGSRRLRSRADIESWRRLSRLRLACAAAA